MVEEAVKKVDDITKYQGMGHSCGTWGGNIASENITWKLLINTTWVSRPITPVVPTDEELFGDVMND